MRPLPGVEQSSHFELQSILWKPHAPEALINDRWLRIGDVIEEYRVTKMSEQAVWLQHAEQTLHLELYPDVRYRMITRSKGK